ncbi:serine hydrolase domain-containing protein [Bacillus carboniphilus]|uniref:Serine hydrolase domain-containing protein n=1 Tax=Bacillus carboniphilus TaxID=86663 RepID=A0ABY9JUL9_9BACI|nr:serine hydrolase domain-containing protein [Bacillus carboniphilus]WLR43084.1 serine hydrolase domain-containing protein [Bacillus carboniphilus]
MKKRKQPLIVKSCTMIIILILLIFVFLPITYVQGQTIKDIEKTIQSTLEQLSIPGASVVIFQNKQPVLKTNFGNMTNETSLLTGSVSKSMTALAILQLVNQKQVEIDRPISDYLSWFHHENASKIKIKHLLSHTSGFSTFLLDCHIILIEKV